MEPPLSLNRKGLAGLVALVVALIDGFHAEIVRDSRGAAVGIQLALPVGPVLKPADLAPSTEGAASPQDAANPSAPPG